MISKYSFVAAAVIMATLPVQAQEEQGPLIDGYIGGTTDLRDRGVSLSDRDIAALASVGAFFENGFYLGLDASTVDTASGADGRFELFTGYSFDRNGYTYDVSVELDTFHGDSSQFFPEFKASVSRDFGLAFTRAGIAYAPGGRWLNPGNDSVYSFADLEVPVPNMPSFTVIGHVGRDFRSNTSNLWDWSAGVSAFVGDIEFSLSYEDSSLDDRRGSGRVIFGARFYF